MEATSSNELIVEDKDLSMDMGHTDDEDMTPREEKLAVKDLATN